MRGAALLIAIACLGCKRPPPNACPAWTVREASGACLARGWALPSSSSGGGEPGGALRSLAMDGKGRGVAVWEVSSPGRTTVQIGEETKAGIWAAQEPLPGINNASVVAAGKDGTAVVAWVHAGEGAGVFIRERSLSGSFGLASMSPMPFAAGAVEPFVAVSKGGEWLLTWCQPTRTGWGVAIARRGAGGLTWERPRDAEDVVSPNVLFANQPRIATNARGDALVAWYQSDGVPLMTYVSERAATGSFSRPSSHDHLSPSGAPVASDPIANPKPALGPHGEAAVAWVQENGHGAAPVYLATRDPHGAWTKPIGLADSFSRPTGAAHGAQLSFSPDGELYVCWLEDGAIYAARRGVDGTWVDGGRSPVRLSSPGRAAYGVTLAAGGRGGVVASWVEIEGAHDERIAARRTGAGHAAWEPLEWLSPEHGGDVGAPSAAMGDDDRALVGWASGAPGVARIVFARVE